MGVVHNNGGSHEDAGCDLIIAWNVFDPFCVGKKTDILSSHVS